MPNDNSLTKEERNELNHLLAQLKQIERLSKQAKQEKIIRDLVVLLIFLLTGGVMFYIEPGILGYLVWLALYGFFLHYIFGVRKSSVPEYNECVKAAKFTVSDCVKIIEHTQIAEIVYSDPDFYVEKYNKLVTYCPHIASETLKTLIHTRPKI